MIISIEGPSAAGKTTWCHANCPGGFVEEASPDIQAPDLYSSPKDAAEFWVERAVERWQTARSTEDANGLAVCDGSPLHLYYSWALWKCGALGGDLFEIEAPLYRCAIEKRRIGFEDSVLWLEVPVAELRRRAAADTARRRRRNEINLSCVPWMKAWFREREQHLPGGVLPLPQVFEIRDFTVRIPRNRYDPTLLDGIIAGLRSTAEVTGCDIAQIG